MRICIVGCGAVGSLFAANLATLEDVEVWAFDVSREHVDAINAGGLRLSGAGEVVGHPRATTDASELPACDFGIVATKAMHTRGAVEATAHAFAEGCLAPVQNGLGNEEAIAEFVPRVIRGTTFPAGKILEPGHVQWDVKGDTTLGPFDDATPLDEVKRLADACTRAGMPTNAVADALPAAVARPVAQPLARRVREHLLLDPGRLVLADVARLRRKDDRRVALDRQEHVRVAVDDVEAGQVPHRPLEARVLAARRDHRLHALALGRLPDQPVPPLGLPHHDRSTPFTSARIASFSGVGTPCSRPNLTIPPFR